MGHNMAKYVLTWKYAQGTALAKHEDVKSLLAAFGKWEEPINQSWLEFVHRVDGQGGLAVIETDNPAGLLGEVVKFMTWAEFEVIPVLDVAISVPLVQRGVEYRESV